MNRYLSASGQFRSLRSKALRDYGELPIFLLATAYTSGGDTVGTASLIPCRWLGSLRLWLHLYLRW